MRKPWPPPSCSDAPAAAGPSGHEEEPARIWREAASAFAEVTSDTLGTSFARVARRASGAPTLALVGHIDEIGVAVTNIEENGLLSFTTRRRHLARDADRPAHRAPDRRTAAFPARSRASASRRSRCATAPRARARRPAHRHRREGRARRRRRSSASATPASGTARRSSCRTAGCSRRALDNRLGAYIALEAARRIAEAKDAQVDVVAVAAVQEEIGLYGARAAAYGLDPQVAIAIDVTPATDYPGGDPRRAGRIELGMGAMIARGPTLNKQVVELLAEAAEAEGIPHAFEVYTRTTSTDADEFHLTRAGIPTGLISIPTRYLHSPNELCASTTSRRSSA